MKLIEVDFLRSLSLSCLDFLTSNKINLSTNFVGIAIDEMEGNNGGWLFVKLARGVKESAIAIGMSVLNNWITECEWTDNTYKIRSISKQLNSIQSHTTLSEHCFSELMPFPFIHFVESLSMNSDRCVCARARAIWSRQNAWEINSSLITAT